ncbi:MAG: esterase-like activity of phytase family protein [Bacteroidales bacterium]|nr:esterase-like activity of phytase family protein [Bacteroidales bacterium]MCM1147443.1 esterase-like activity of phytase family protein [Bacteroidales bacterium]MCM1206112.1 esterase-like activity of phytase family protein [Bacillota bacterium]MCM1510057.1 esterase-like activity of phytase family protein [Clostridium sp.]
MDLLSQINLALFGIFPGNYSGISHVEGTQYVVVDDKDMTDGFKILNISIDSLSGKVKNASMIEPEGMKLRRDKQAGIYRDCEGIAYFAPNNTVFISGEEDQRIIEYSMDGVPTGRSLSIPLHMQCDKIEKNLGFEALTYNATTGYFWTTTESTLPGDGKRSSLCNRNWSNRLRLQSFGNDLLPVEEYVYAMDIPTVKKAKGVYAHGVPSMIALDDGRLIVMEREVFISPKKIGSFCNVKLYIVNPSRSVPINNFTDLSMGNDSIAMKKHLLVQFCTYLRIGKMNFANYEGMCLGPRLAGGKQTLILIADSQGGAGNSFYRLKDYLRIIIFDSEL